MNTISKVLLWFFIGIWLVLPAFAGEDEVLIDGPEVDLTVADLQRALEAMPATQRESTLATPAKLRKVMDQTYMTKVAAHRALQHGLEQDAMVRAKIENYRRNVLAAAEVKRAVSSELPTEKEYLEAARDLYQARKERYRVPERVKVRHILLKPEGNESDEQLKERARKLHGQIVAGELDFKVAATRHSQDTATAPRGGLLQPFSRGRMVKPFEDAAFALKREGQISEPVKTRYGYHLILLERRYPAREIPFEEVKGQLVKEVREKAESQAKTQYWLEVRDDPAIKLNQKLIDQMLREPKGVLVQEKEG